MATQKITAAMILEVDLQCPLCYKKVQKTLCKLPEVRDRAFDPPMNQVLITVVCCSPEKLRDKLYRKGGKSIKSITIDYRTETTNHTAAYKAAEPQKKNVAEKPKLEGKAENEKPKKAPKPKPAEIAEPVAIAPAALQVMRPGPALVQGVPSVFSSGGPSHHAYTAGPYGFPPPPQPLYEGYYGHGVPNNHVSRSDNYFNEENPQTCTIM